MQKGGVENIGSYTFKPVLVTKNDYILILRGVFEPKIQKGIFSGKRKIMQKHNKKIIPFTLTTMS